MNELLTVRMPHVIEAPWGNVRIRWEEPASMRVVIFHTIPMLSRESPEIVGEVPFAESVFWVTLRRQRRGNLAIAVSHSRDDTYGADPRLTPRAVLDRDGVSEWEHKIARWLRRWIAQQTPDVVLACALAHHNAYVDLRDTYESVEANQLALHERRMIRCVVQATRATDWLLQLPRPPVREFALLHYVPLVGETAATVTRAGLHLEGLRA